MLNEWLFVIIFYFIICSSAVVSDLVFSPILVLFHWTLSITQISVKYRIYITVHCLNTYGHGVFSAAAQQPGTLSQILSVIQQAVQTVCSKRTCSCDTSASSTLGVLINNVLHKSTHLHIHSMSVSGHPHLIQSHVNIIPGSLDKHLSKSHNKKLFWAPSINTTAQLFQDHQTNKCPARVQNKYTHEGAILVNINCKGQQQCSLSLPLLQKLVTIKPYSQIKGLWKILRVSWTAKKTNKWVLNKAEEQRELLDTVKARKLAYYCHTRRKHGSCLEKRHNARNNARCTQARKTMHGLDGQHQDVDRTLRGRVNQNDRGQG